MTSREELQNSDDDSNVVFLTSDEVQDLETAEARVTPIAFAGQDFDIDGLVRRLSSGDIVVPGFGTEDPEIETAGFQRGFVWSKKQMDRLVESVLLGYPIPGLFLVRQQTDMRYLVLDGQQRLRTLQAFRKGIYRNKVFSLENVADEFKGLTYETLPERLRRIFDSAFLQATVVTTDGTSESLEAVYQIFERLNAGGTQLTPHEIRIALYAGPLVSELDRLNKNAAWRELYSESQNPRLRDQELILRVMALFLEADSYTRPLKGFLNDFAGKHRNVDDSIRLAAAKFESAADLILAGPGRKALRKASSQVNAAQSEALFVGLMHRLESKSINGTAVTDAFEILMRDSEFDAATTRSTADELVVKTRLRIARNIFGNVA